MIRDGVVFCLRTDKEKTLENEDILKSIIKGKYPDYAICYADNLVNRCILPEDREKEVYAQLGKFASSKLVVTDRLHGMIFAAITATPCIALDNCNGKVGGVYEWIKENEFIRFCKDLNEVKQAVETLDLDKGYQFNKSAIEEAMKPLVEEIDEK